MLKDHRAPGPTGPGEHFERNPLPTWLVEPDSDLILAANDAAVRHYGFDREQFLAMRFADLSPDGADDFPLAAARTAALAHGGALSCRHRTRGGRLLEVQLHAGAASRGDCGPLLMVAIDVTGLRLLEQASDRQHARVHLLEASIARLNDILMITEAEPIDAPGPRIVFVNDAFERRTGYSRSEVIGKSPRILQGPATQRDELDRICAALRRWQPVRAELINYTKAGDPFWLELDIVPVADENGWYTHWVSVERDITERKLIEGRLGQHQRLESLGQLTGGVAHDFNNLLTVILGNAELLAEDLPAGRWRQMAEFISTAAQRGADLTGRLLAFSRRQPLAPKVVRVDELTVAMSGLLSRTLGEHIEIHLTGEDGLAATLIDPAQLENALLNLALNARDAMPDGGRLAIDTRNVQLSRGEGVDLEPGAYVAISVTDTGTGIRPEHLDRVFEPFFTTKERGGGTGLGLAMVYGFVKQSNGHVTIRSEIGRGTTVRLLLPRVDHQEAAAESVTAVAPAIGGRELVLVVEDEPLVREFVVSQFVSLGYRVLEAANGAAALALLRDRPDIDLLFTDIVMPGEMNGGDLARSARDIHPGLPVLFTSGYTEDVLGTERRLPADAQLLSKPYRRRELAGRIRAALSSSAGRH